VGGEGGAVTEGAEEDGADGRAPPRDRDDGDGLYLARRQRPPGRAERRIGRCVGDEYRLPGLQRAPELGVPVEVHDVIADARIFVARHQPYAASAPLREEDRAAVEAEGFPQTQRHRAYDVAELQRATDVLQDLDYRQQVLPLLLQRTQPGLQPFDLIDRRRGRRHGWHPERIG